MTGADSANVVQVALAEFSALRSEIDQKHAAQLALLSLNVTVSGGLVGLVLTHKAPVTLLVLVPVASSALTLLARQQMMVASILGRYIRDRIGPVLRDVTEEHRLMRFEHYYIFELSSRPGWFVHPIADRLLMPSAAGCVLVFLPSHLSSAVEWTAWCVGLLLTLAQLAEGLRSVRGLRVTRLRALRRSATSLRGRL